MSVNWSWSAKFAEIDLEQTIKGETNKFTIDVYYANCLCAMILETPEMKEKQEYQFVGFFSDIDHLKRCVGLLKCYDGTISNLYDGSHIDKWTEIRIDMYNRDKYQIKHHLKIGDTLVQAGFRVIYDNFKYGGKKDDSK